MRIIHCADLHLDSRLQTHLNREKAKMRRDELLRNFERLAEYASGNGVEVILISGDLFDTDTVSALAANTVLAVIAAHPRIRFYYLRGNHDTGDCLARLTGSRRMESRGEENGTREQSSRKNTDSRWNPPANLFFFGSRWKTYPEGKNGLIAISGVELTRENSASAHAALRLDPERFNIVMLHGQTESGGVTAGREGPLSGGIRSGDPDVSAADTGSTGTISLRALRGKGIDYLALGHIHSWKTDKLDSRGIFCYPGCLEGRGFDECGKHGFALLEIDENGRLTGHRFIPFAQRTLYALQADVTGCMTTAQITEKIRDKIQKERCTAKDMADVTLCGELDVDCEKDTGYIASALSSYFFFARLRDRTSLRINLGDYLYDESLRGEFVRRVMADDSVGDSEKIEVIRLGFKAMDGEEL